MRIGGGVLYLGLPLIYMTSLSIRLRLHYTNLSNSSMTAVLTTSMTLRIILSVRGTLVHGGSFAVSSTSNPSRSGGTTHVLSGNRREPTNPVLSLSHQPAPTAYAVPLGQKERSDWGAPEYDGKSSVGDNKEAGFPIEPTESNEENLGVKITVDTQTDYESYGRAK